MRRFQIKTRGEHGKLEMLTYGGCKPEVFEKMAADWQSFLQNDTPKSGAYEYHFEKMDNTFGESRAMVLSFAEIVAIV